MSVSQPEEGKVSNLEETQVPFDASVEESKLDPKEREEAIDQFLDKPYAPQLDLTDDQRRGIVEMVKLDWDTDSAAVDPYINGRLKDILERYEQDVVKGRVMPFEGSSTVSMADIPIAVETVHPRLFGAVWNDHLVQWKALNSASIANVHNVTNFAEWVFKVDMDELFEKVDELCHSTALLGTTVTMHGWEKMREVYWDIVRKIDPQTKKETIDIKENVRLKERAFIYNLNLEDIPLPLTEGSNLHRMSHLGRRFYLTSNEILNFSVRGKYGAVDKESFMTNVDELIKQDGELAQRLQSGGFSLPAIQQRYRNELIDWYGQYDPFGSGFPVECQFVVHPRLNLLISATLLFTPDGQRPFEKSTLIPRKNIPYGIGIPELIRVLSEERDIIHRQRIDAGAVSIIPFGGYRAASGFKPDSLVLQPGTMIPLDDINDIKFFQFSSPFQILAGEEAQTQAQIEKLSTSGSYQQGRESELMGSRATKGGTLAIIGQGNIRFSLLGKRLQNSVSKVFTKIIKWYQWVMPPGLAEKVLGSNGKQLFPHGLTREMIAGQFSAFLTGDTDTSNKDFERQIATLVLQTQLQNPLVIRFPSRIWEVESDWLRAHSKTDVERIIGPRPPDSNFAESAERMIEQIKQGFLPEPAPGENHILQLAAMTAFAETEEFRALESERQALVPMLINALKMELVKTMSRAAQGQQQGGQPGMQQGQGMGGQQMGNQMPEGAMQPQEMISV